MPNFGLRKTLVGLFLIFYGVLVVGIGAVVILVIKYIPLHIWAIHRYLLLLEELCTCIGIGIGFIPFWLVGLVLVLAAGPITLIVGILCAPLIGLRCPYYALQQDNLVRGLNEAKVVLTKLDGDTGHWSFRMLPSMEMPVDERPASPDGPQTDLSMYFKNSASFIEMARGNEELES